MARIVDASRQNIIGENARRARKRAKLSQQQLADKLETMAVYVCRGSISRLERGDRTVTDIEIAGIAKVLGVTIAELFDEKNVG